MIQTFLTRVISALVTKFIEFIGKFLIDFISDIKDKNEIKKAMESEDRQAGARSRNDTFRS